MLTKCRRKHIIDKLVAQDIQESHVTQDYLNSLLRVGLVGYNSWTDRHLLQAWRCRLKEKEKENEHAVNRNEP